MQYTNKIPTIFYFRNRSICPILTLLPSKWRHDAGDEEFGELSRIWKLGDRWSQQNWKFIYKKNSKFGRSWQNRQNIIGIKFNHVHVILIWVLPYLAQLQAERIMRFIKLKSWFEVGFWTIFWKKSWIFIKKCWKLNFESRFELDKAQHSFSLKLRKVR